MLLSLGVFLLGLALAVMAVAVVPFLWVNLSTHSATRVILLDPCFLSLMPCLRVSPVFGLHQEMRRTAQEMQRLTRALEREIPDTAATMRLTGMELSDAISEVSALRYLLKQIPSNWTPNAAT